MIFQIGNKIRVLDDNQRGEIIHIENNQVVILNEFGFEESYSTKEIILDAKFEIGEVSILPDSTSVNPEKTGLKKITNSPKEIDLHFDSLVDYPSRYTPFEMLQIQLEKVKFEMDLAQNEKRKKIILIHGHGKGKLKKEIFRLLKNYKGIEIYDASFRKFNGGATVVEWMK